ncbi:hypothetical protein QBC33DRAFT_537990 [Phialemonium atrogriseum]|uniref:Uncharacterized protein n=1 Tax=Phialemonium atrogriseum TaxID=1093897 RepID=A0AAJ0FNN1_9PEZI|nr:uncharacterized protein QBC33DRAFT_537990 [Phialemonium atrogriseum]KAK1767325.1 hypothetical protein QBC33DRAFT_537990 [Phialemonium atrogriseum]
MGCGLGGLVVVLVLVGLRLRLGMSLGVNPGVRLGMRLVLGPRLAPSPALGLSGGTLVPTVGVAPTLVVVTRAAVPAAPRAVLTVEQQRLWGAPSLRRVPRSGRRDGRGRPWPWGWSSQRLHLYCEKERGGGIMGEGTLPAMVLWLSIRFTN